MIGGIAVIGITLLVLGAWVSRGQIRDAIEALSRPELPSPIGYSPTVEAATTTSNPNTKPTAPTKPVVVPTPAAKALNLAVSFMLQAPKQNWVQPYEDACEEASALMLDGYFDKRSKAYEPDEALALIDALVAWEDKTFGHNQHTDANETARILREYFGYKKVEVRAIKTAEDIKTVLDKGLPVLAPSHGKALLNPNFKNGGPEYHMVVIKGYTKEGDWITNDPGTRKGADYIYPKQRLLDAIHDYDAEDMRDGRKVIIIVTP